MFQCVPNLSEGRRPEVVQLVRETMSRVPGVCLADLSHDFDHNRMVVSLLGEAEGLQEAIVRLFEVALEHIDMSVHQGVHPRIGAVDVIPFVPLGTTTMAEAIALARTLAERVAREFELPVFLYEEAALRPERRRLPDLRAPGLEERVREPDFGPPRMHPRLGASVLGARWPLVAYNIVLNSQDMPTAGQIARSIRERNGGLRGVRALAVWLESRQRAQISINLVEPAVTGFYPVFRAVEKAAAQAGIAIESSELIGLTPLAVLAETAAQALKMHDFKPTQILEVHPCPKPI